MSRAAAARHRIDDALEAWGRWVYRNRLLVLGLSLGIVATLGSFLPQMRVENSVTSFLRDDDSAALVYEEFQRQFGQDDRILIAVEPPNVFEPAFLEKLRSFHRDLETQVPHLAEVTSLVNARQTRGDGDTLVVGELLETWRAESGDPAELRRRVFANPLYVDQLISRSGRITTVTLEPVVYSALQSSDVRGRKQAVATVPGILEGFDEPEDGAGVDSLELLSEDEKQQLVFAVERIVDRYAGPEFVIHVAGGPVLVAQMTRQMGGEALGIMVVATLVIALLLYGLFRRVSGVALPLIVVAASLVGNLGTMVWLGIPFSVVLGMLPVFTMCVGICNSVHVLILVYRRLDVGDTRENAIAYAFAHSGLAITMTSLTTAAGMLSFVSAGLVPIQHLGITAPFGVLYAYLFSMTLLPALIGMLPIRNRVDGRDRATWIERLLVWTGDLATHRPLSVLGGGLAILIVSALGIANLRFAHDPISWFPEDDPIRIAVELIDREMRGSTTTEVTIDTGRENGLHEPAVLQRIEAAAAMARSIARDPIYVGQAISLVDIVKETHQALNANHPAYYAIPDTRPLVAQELLLFENSGSDDLESITDSRFSTARLSLRLPMADAVLYRSFLTDLETHLARTLGDELRFTLTGLAVIQVRAFTALTESMARSYLIALLVITPLMILLIRNLRLSLISMVPNLAPVFVTLGVMGVLGISLDASTIMIGSMIIGLAVDDTIHFLHRFRREFEATGNTREAVRATMVTTGSALFFTSLVLGTGFATMGLMGNLTNTIHFGYLSAFGIIVAFAADALLTPALIALTARLSELRWEEMRIAIEDGAIESPAIAPAAID